MMPPLDPQSTSLPSLLYRPAAGRRSGRAGDFV